MKKIALIAIAALTAMSVNAQYYNTKHEVQVSVGSASNSEIISGLSEAFGSLGEIMVTSIMTAGNVYAFDSYENEKYLPSLAVGYYYNVSKMVAVGGYFAMNGMTRDIYGHLNTQTRDSKKKVGESDRYNFSLIPSVKFHWVRTKYFGFYSKVGIGAMLMTEKAESDNGGTSKSDSDLMFDFDITPIGLDGGTEHIRAFAEFGLSEQGMLCGGLRYKF